ncbi:MAG: hypothetical protein Q8941_07360 [Bacteroidota bacterium]|nr:hypothetical protein [Bacteroidota bacterium]
MAEIKPEFLLMTIRLHQPACPGSILQTAGMNPFLSLPLRVARNLSSTRYSKTDMS